MGQFLSLCNRQLSCMFEGKNIKREHFHMALCIYDIYANYRNLISFPLNLQICVAVPCHIFKFWAFFGIMFQV